MNDITRGGRSGGDPGSGERARIAVVSTPRSGNTWLRFLLSTWYGLEQHVAHRPAEVSWEPLPPQCILQLHWGRDEAFEASLRRHEFRVVTIARHPLDTLISLLHWVDSCPDPPSVWKENPCLAGRAGDERPLMGVSPLSPAFLDYATGPRAAALLSVTREWWTAHGRFGSATRRLVAAPARELERLGGELGWAPRSPAADAIAVNTIDRLRILHSDRPQHFRQGRPGLWRELIPAAAARRIEAAHRDVFKGLAYACDPDEGLDDVRADLN